MQYLYKHVCYLLVLLCSSPCYGQACGYMFRGATRDRVGNLWFGTTGLGVYRYDASSGVLTTLTERDGLCANNVSSILEDKAGKLWFSTNQGVCRYDGKSFSKFVAKDSLCPFGIDLLLEDRNGDFWFGTNGCGVYRYNLASGKFTHFTTEQGLGSNAVQCMLEDKAGNLWLGERGGGVSRYDAAGRFTKFNGGGCFSAQIMKIIEDRMGNIWFANLYQGLCRYNPTSGSFTHFTEKDGLCHNTVTSLYEDKKGNLWFGSDAGKAGKVADSDAGPVGAAGGLCRYDGKSFTRFTEKDGISHTDVSTIVEDNNGTIWVGSKGGLYRYHSASGRFVDFTYKAQGAN